VTWLSKRERWVVLAIGAEDRYGLDILRRIEQATGKRLWLATLYLTLNRLELRGLVEGRMSDERIVVRHGARRRYYRLTEDGIYLLREVKG
jgi:PadR family transcriptional regulator, regulatory protein PadR